MGQVDPDLVRAAGFQPKTQQGIGPSPLQNPVMSLGGSAFWGYDSFELAGDVQNGGVDYPTDRLGRAAGQSQVFPVKLAAVQLGNQQAVDITAFGYSQQAGGMAIQPVRRPEDKGLDRKSVV